MPAPNLRIPDDISFPLSAEGAPGPVATHLAKCQQFPNLQIDLREIRLTWDCIVQLGCSLGCARSSEQKFYSEAPYHIAGKRDAKTSNMQRKESMGKAKVTYRHNG